MKKLCCVFNYNPLYRYPIYRAMSEEMKCDFYFGDNVFQPLKQFDPDSLKGFRKMLHVSDTGIKGYKWTRGICPLFKGYSDYLITGQPDYLLNWLLILFCKFTGKHIYCWAHGVKKYDLEKFTWRTVYKWFFKSMDGILLYGRYNIPYMKSLGVSEARMYIIHNSLNTPLQTRIYQKLTETGVYQEHFGNNHPTIIYIGRIQARKRIDLLIAAVALLNKQDSPVNLILVGNSTDDESIPLMVKNLGIENQIWFYGPCYDEQKNAELLYNAAVCVCPAAVGLTAIHALSFGTPVVSNDEFDAQMPEFEAVKKDVTGSFYKADDTEDLAHEILRWTRKTPKERAKIREEARHEITESWSIAYQIGILRHVFPQYFYTSPR